MEINEDESEMNDFAKQYPDIVDKLAQQWRAWANTHQVYPKTKK